ncbi:uncharacterized protein NFIA_054300 [Aspergillus fischeri NRRL 181]|uniref:Uncharacterized protein n=1 Tax=Neosartorya fischeri (strain ATCC 1020 / DSM 3700 / CBS 544.65 / FGSC A1164 / JCM 1740 / NRRL 181 / WB 181) TaxID=331117 RepID=A1DMR3_NEOFI|nr:uncharacterized protein NFIA_054300 [Aspergillus fischeri NRRL 181]EAW16084.1 hypothetical protein NFIA_054300 [Aspergillus fischeri NRRL 181]KAG2025837.1 hypothetical protein GB937_002559 [Aspergillus fischeri]
MPEILLPDTSSITSSTASSLLLYTNHQHQTTLTRRKSLPLRRLSVWLSRRISKQGLNATYDNTHHTLTHDENYTDYDAQKVTSDLSLNREREHEHDRKIKEYEAERNLSESYAAYCRAFTSAGEHLYHQKRRTWMMDGEADLTMISEDSVHGRGHGHGHPEEDEEDEGGVLDEPSSKAVPSPDTELELELELGLSPPPHILTPSLYAEMRRVASDKKQARKRLRERRLWSWFTWIRQRESH